MIRVLVADDSPTARALITEILYADPSLEVVGEARDGREAVRLAQALRPDVVTMDIRMPVMDGFQATREIMRSSPTRIVVVSGSPGLRDAAFSMRAIEAGALDVLRKPPGPESPHFDREAQALVKAVKAMSAVKVVRRRIARSGDPRPPIPEPRAEVQVVAIAASTGGPQALKRVLGGLPADFPVPILVVQHLAAGFMPGFLEWLDGVCGLRVLAAEEGRTPRPNCVYVAPDNRHLVLDEKGRMRLSETAPVEGFRPSATVLFEAVARVRGAHAIGIILSGMGEDGVDGLRNLQQAGGLTIGQSEESCVVFGMPRAALVAGVIDSVLDCDAIAGALVRQVRRP